MDPLPSGVIPPESFLSQFDTTPTVPLTDQMAMDVPVFDFTSVLYDLLTSPNLDFDGSYIFKTDNPLDQPATDTMYDDFDSGSRYINSFRMYQNEQNDLPLPIILFIDSANVTGNDRISVEAVMMQLGIHNRDTRYSDKSFRNLGVIPKLSSRFYKGKENGLRKMKDYHAVLDCILSDISLVNKTGLNWVLQWKGKFFNVVLRPYILAILGDYPGHNVICGKMGGNNKLSKCRTCVVPNDRLSDTSVFPHIFCEDYCGATSIGNDLSAISMHRIKNAILLSLTSFCGETGGCLGVLKKESIVLPDAVFPADAVFPDAAEAEAVEATEAVTEPLLGVDGTLLFFILRVASRTAMEKRLTDSLIRGSSSLMFSIGRCFRSTWYLPSK